MVDSIANIKVSISNNKLLLTLLLLFSMIYFGNLFGEKLYFYKDGLGIDGAIYGRMLRGLPESLYNNTVPGYWYQKFFPVIVARVIIEVSSMPIDNPLIIKAFTLIDTLCVFASMIVGYRISKHLGFTKNQVLMAFVLTFFSFSILKYAPYQPLLTDRVAFLESLLLLYYYLKQNLFGGLIVGFLGLFTFPLVIWMTATILFSVSNNANANNSSNNGNAIPTIMAAIVAVLPIAITGYNYFFDKPAFSWYYNHDQTTLGFNDFKGIVTFVASAFCVSLFLFCFFFNLFKRVDIKGALNSLYWKRLIMFAAMFIVLKIVLFLNMATESGYDRSAFDFIENISHQSLVSPYGFIASHFMFFGSGVLLFLIGFKKIVSRVQLGMLMLLLLNGYFLISTESREFIYLLPYIVFVVVRNMNSKIAGDRLFLFLVLIINLCVSLFWFRVNVPEIWSVRSSRLDFPWQRFYMLLGPWRNMQMYAVYTVATVISLLIIYMYLKRYKLSIIGGKPTFNNNIEKVIR